MASFILSEYAEKLDPLAKMRYKLTGDGGKFNYKFPDRYVIPENEWEKDVKKLPPVKFGVTYIYLTTSNCSDYDAKTLKNYKSYVISVSYFSLINMIDLASPNKGAQIVMASSNDSRFPPTNILDGKSDTFWTTTGLYPQIFVLALSEAADVKTITIQSYNIKDLKIEKTIKEDPVDFEDVLETGFESAEGAPQQKTFSPALCEARYLKFIIKSGYDHFCAVYKLSVNGMSVPFSSDEAESIHRQISNEDKALIDSIVNIPYTVSLELDRCIKWITDHKFSKVALQFPDNLLGVCSSVAQFLTARTEAKFFVLADTSYGSCCVDEVTADHVSADAIIHFGHACLSLTERLPVLYIFAKYCLDVPHVISSFKECFPDVFSSVIIYYEVNYHHIIGEVAENLKEYENLVISELAFSKEDYRTVLEKNKTEIIKNQRSFILPKTKDLKDYTVFYIGCQLEAFNNVMLSLNKCRFYFYNTLKKTVEDNTKCISRFLSKRYYYVERTKDARIIGILVGTLGVSNYISTIKRLREAIIKANKKSYVIVVGKRNVAKLANFVNIEVFVNVACLESTVVDCRQFLQPIITPYELEIALNIREWTDEYITNFAELLPDGAHHVPISEMKQETDVSLITGKIRSLGSSNISDEIKDKSSTAVVQRDEMAISDIHSAYTAGEFLSQCSWKGLEQKLGETPIADIQPGRKGIASGYEDEKTEQNR